MTLFQELDLTTFSGGQISGIEPGSVAEALGLQPGDELLAINGAPVEDVIDVQFYGAEEHLTLTIRRNGEVRQFEAERAYNQPLGLAFTHPTFDTDIRRCNNLCEFCFVLQMAPKFRRTLYIKDDDYRYSFLFGHYVTLTNLNEHDWWRIETMGLSPLYVSVHVTDWEMRRQYLRNPDAPDILAQLEWLAERGIEVHTQIVVTPGVNDGRILDQSIADLTAFYPAVQSISVVPVGLTKHHKYGLRPHTPAEARAVITQMEAYQAHFLQEFGSRFVYLTDEWYLVAKQELPSMTAYDGQQLEENGLGMVRHFLNEWEGVKGEIRDSDSVFNHQSLTLVTGTLFAPVLRETAVQFTQLTGAEVTVEPVVNQKLGKTITVAGLLMGGDVLNHLQTVDFGDLIVLPRVMFDHPDRIALDNLSPQDIANQLKRPIALADTMGDVWDALTGQSQVMFEPGVRSEGLIDLRVINNSDAENNTYFS